MCPSFDLGMIAIGMVIGIILIFIIGKIAGSNK